MKKIPEGIHIKILEQILGGVSGGILEVYVRVFNFFSVEIPAATLGNMSEQFLEGFLKESLEDFLKEILQCIHKSKLP